MPPLGFQEYEQIKSGPATEAMQIEADAGHKIRQFLRKRQDSEGDFMNSFKRTRRKGYPTQKAIYSSPTAERGQRISAWFVEHGIGQDVPTEVYIQAQHKNNGEWKNVDKPTRMATVHQIWGEVTYEFVDVTTLTEDARLQLAQDFSQTVDLVIEAGEAALRN